jgi:predicted CxxxxCH...CXXCH cytochrome family protein
VPRRDPDARRAADRARDATPERRAAARQRMRAKRWREGTTYRCAGCHGRFNTRRQAWREIGGRRVRLGLCAFCASQQARAA